MTFSLMKPIKEALKSVIYKALSFEPVLGHLRKRKLSRNIVVLMYHEIACDSDEIEAWTVVKESDFVRQMEYLSAHFNIISLKDALYQINNRDAYRMQRPSIVITFDDGYRGNRKVLFPIVKSMNIPATIFVATKTVQDGQAYWYDRLFNALERDKVITLKLNHLSLGNYQINKHKGVKNWGEIERLLFDLKKLEPNVREKAVESILKGFNDVSKNDTYKLSPLSISEVCELSEDPLITIGAHSHCHNLLTQLTEDNIINSVKTSKQLLEAWTGKPVSYFAYPNGNYNDIVIDILKKTGFKCGLTTEVRAWEGEESFFTIPRVGIGRYDSFDYFKVKISGVFA